MASMTVLADHALQRGGLHVDDRAIWPVTVIVSSTAPSFISASIVAVNEPVSSMPSRLNVLNPGSVNVTE